MKNKGVKAQSAIIVTILLILIVIVAVVILWNVFGKVVEDSGDKAETNQFYINLKITEAYISEDNLSLKVTVKRNVGKGEIASLIFLLKDKNGDQYKANRTVPIPEELETFTYEMNETFSPLVISDFSDIGLVSLGFTILNSDNEVITSEIFTEYAKSLRDSDGDIPITPYYIIKEEGTIESIFFMGGTAFNSINLPLRSPSYSLVGDYVKFYSDSDCYIITSHSSTSWGSHSDYPSVGFTSLDLTTITSVGDEFKIFNLKSMCDYYASL